MFFSLDIPYNLLLNDFISLIQDIKSKDKLLLLYPPKVEMK